MFGMLVGDPSYEKDIVVAVSKRRATTVLSIRLFPSNRSFLMPSKRNVTQTFYWGVSGSACVCMRTYSFFR